VEVNIEEDIELGTNQKAVCGKCVNFGGPPHHNFGTCMAVDDFPLHALFRSDCQKYETPKKRRRAQAELQV
jgi:hypothetical protein